MLTQDIIIISIIAVVCIIMFFAGLRLRRNERRLDTIWIRTKGQIISYNPRDAGVGVQTTGKVTWYKKVKFVTQDGREIVFEGRLGALPGEPGREISVIYDPSNPESALIDTFVEREAPWMIFVSVSVLILLSLWIAFVFLGELHWS